MNRWWLVCAAVTVVVGCNKSGGPAPGGNPVPPVEAPSADGRRPPEETPRAAAPARAAPPGDRSPPPAAADGVVRVGQPAPPIHLKKLLQAPADAPTTLDKLKGKAVVLEFWFTSCAPCVAAFPHLNELVEQTKGDPVVFIAVTEETEGRVAKFLAEKPLSTWVGLDDRAATTTGYGVRAFPTTVLIDPAGVVRAITDPTAVTAAMVKDLAHGRPLKAVPGGVDELPKLYKDTIRPSVPAASGGLDLDKADFFVYLGPPDDRLGQPVTGTDVFRSPRVSARSVLAWCYNVPLSRLTVDSPDADKEFGCFVRVPNRGGVTAQEVLRQAAETTLGVRGAREKREMDVWVLKKTGPDGGPPKFTGDPSLGGRAVGLGTDGSSRADNMPLSYLVHPVERFTQKTVIDDTGLAGTYDWALRFKSPQLADVNAELEKIGLSLTAERRPVEVVVVRKAGK